MSVVLYLHLYDNVMANACILRWAMLQQGVARAIIQDHTPQMGHYTVFGTTDNPIIPMFENGALMTSVM